MQQMQYNSLLQSVNLWRWTQDNRLRYRALREDLKERWKEVYASMLEKALWKKKTEQRYQDLRKFWLDIERLTDSSTHGENYLLHDSNTRKKKTLPTTTRNRLSNYGQREPTVWQRFRCINNERAKRPTRTSSDWIMEFKPHPRSLLETSKPLLSRWPGRKL